MQPWQYSHWVPNNLIRRVMASEGESFVIWISAPVFICRFLSVSPAFSIRPSTWMNCYNQHKQIMCLNQQYTQILFFCVWCFLCVSFVPHVTLGFKKIYMKQNPNKKQISTGYTLVLGTSIRQVVFCRPPVAAHSCYCSGASVMAP